MKNIVQFDNDQIPVNARVYNLQCIHCNNKFLVRVCDDEYWCYKCKDYVMVEDIKWKLN